MPLSLGLGEVASIWVRQSRSDSKRKGEALPDRRGSGVIRCSQRAGCTYSSITEASFCKVPQGFHVSTPPASLQPHEPLGVVRGHSLSSHLSHLQKCWTTSEVNSVPGSQFEELLGHIFRDLVG